MELWIVPEQLLPVSLLGKGTEANVTTILLHEGHMNEQNDHKTTRVAELTTIPAVTESTVVLVTSNSGPFPIERIQTAKATTGTPCVRYT